ncbi:Gfo/Idh/MocA family oxidoreductase [Saccharospirillum impatiens]|uniref:Gfo/Idh/MocA family oxidoreductase n=1 Tax=Saccharospirillum impatiens TaxID=169438 RepID=UPI0004114B4F|nr:Gfo/Idh/MocA family oxidoreductase [Saccharospirillum impatiens]
MAYPAIRTGIIGYGLSGRVFHAPFIQGTPEFELTAVCSRQPEAIHERYPDTTVVEDAGQLIASQLDLIIITAPNALHFPLAEAALKAGKDVLLEKPSVTSLQEIETLTQLAKTQNRLLTVYQNRRFDGDFLHLKALINSGELGALKHLTSRFDRFRPIPQNRWREQPGPASGIFWDLGPHLLDQALHLLGSPDSLQASLKVLRTGGTTPDWFEVMLYYPDLQVTLGSTPFEAGPMRRFNARFEQGSWHCWGLDPQEEALRGGQMPWLAAYPDAGQAQTAKRYSASDDGRVTEQPDDCSAGQYQAYFKSLARAIHTRSEPPVSLNDARALLYTLELAEQSSSEGKRLDWNYSQP